MKETQLYSLIAAFERYAKLMAELNDSIHQQKLQSYEAYENTFNRAFALSASMMDKIKHDLSLIKNKEMTLTSISD